MSFDLEKELFRACAEGDVVKCRQLILQHGANAQEMLKEKLVIDNSGHFHPGDTPRTIASRYGHREIMKFLVQFVSYLPKSEQKSAKDFAAELCLLKASELPNIIKNIRTEFDSQLEKENVGDTICDAVANRIALRYVDDYLLPGLTSYDQRIREVTHSFLSLLLSPSPPLLPFVSLSLSRTHILSYSLLSLLSLSGFPRSRQRSQSVPSAAVASDDSEESVCGQRGGGLALWPPAAVTQGGGVCWEAVGGDG